MDFRRLFLGFVLSLSTLIAAHMAQDPATTQEKQVGPLQGREIRFVPLVQGLPLQWVISDRGKTIGPAQQTARGEGWAGGLVLEAKNLAFDGSRLTGSLTLTNRTGTSLHGVRLDFTQGIERLKTVTEDGKAVERNEAFSPFVPPPLFYGDLAEGQSEGPFPFVVDEIPIHDDTVAVAIDAVVSGVRYQTETTLGDTRPVQLVLDGQRRVWLACGSQGLYRLDRPGTQPVRVKDLPTHGLAIDPAQGLVWISSEGDLAALRENGSVAGRWTPAAQGFDAMRGPLHLLKDGSLVGFTEGAGLQAVTPEGKKRWSTSGITSRGGFGVTPRGEPLLASDDGSVIRINSLGQKDAVLLKPGSGALGSLSSAAGVAFDPEAASLVVLESGKTDGAARMSEFDPNGRWIRSWQLVARPIAGQAPRDIVSLGRTLLVICSGAPDQPMTLRQYERF